MPYRKFGKNDIRINTLKAHPRCEFFIEKSQIYHNDRGRQLGQFQTAGETPGNAYMTDTGRVNLYEYNIDRLSGSNNLIIPYLSKDSSRVSLSVTGTYDSEAYENEFAYGDLIKSSYPQETTIRRMFIQRASGSAQSRNRNTAKSTCPHNMNYFSLRNMLTLYGTLSSHYLPVSHHGNKDTQRLNLIHIPSILYGDKIRPGTVSLRWYYTGSIAAELTDPKENGELIQTGPYGSVGSGSVAGVILYNEGFVLLTGSWQVTNAVDGTLGLTGSGGDTGDYGRWIYWGAGCRDGITMATAAARFERASFGLSFEGVTNTQVLTLYAHADRGKVNYSNNPTFLKYNQRQLHYTSSHVYEENPERLIKNTRSSSFPGHKEKFKRQVYISKVTVYDKDRNLIGVATLPAPILKEEEQSLSFKLKMDI